MKEQTTKKSLSPFHLVLMSMGGMVGTGWLFSPYYVFQGAGVWAILSWIIAAVLILFIAFTFAEVVTFITIRGGFMRFFDITHSKSLGFMMIIIGWLSYVVYLPIEAQGATQYIAFWFPSLINNNAGTVTLSLYGLILSFLIMIILTMFNSSHVKRVANANAGVSICKIILPLTIAIFVIVTCGKVDNVTAHYSNTPFNFSNILFAITSSGVAFAFTGFQNGLILAADAKNPRIALPLSVIAPVLIGLVMYILLTMIYMFCLDGDTSKVFNATAPLLGILSLLGLNYLFVILFVDAVVSPLGTANVYTAVTARILQTVGTTFSWKKLEKLNKNDAPIVALWINFFIALLFLVPAPTWAELVNFLSTLVMLICLSGPVSLMVFRKIKPHGERKFRLKAYALFGYLGFIGCTLFVYWSGLSNLVGLFVLSLILLIIYQFTMVKQYGKAKIDAFMFISYLGLLLLISYSVKANFIPFPYDHILVIILSVIYLNLFVSLRDSEINIDQKMEKISLHG
ncbi:APC family permease [Pseudofrancisella aestuarii]|uniref:APC family permease n=1 Tax=Pseudofrancisella aestuarii TaxID=2670347 RepID=A0ABV9TD33_9GAMM|nr:APC family permease [Pseudofrancisella aestuarii]